MDSERFLNELSEELRKIGVDETIITRRVGQFEKYFATLPPDEVAEMLAGLGDIEEIALNIQTLSAPKNKKPESALQLQAAESTETIDVGANFDVFSPIPREDESIAPVDSEKTVEFEAMHDAASIEETRSIDLNSLREAARTGNLPKAQNTDALYEELLLDDDSSPSENMLDDDVLSKNREENLSPIAKKRRDLSEAGDEYRHIELDFNELDDTESDVEPTAKGQAIFLVGTIVTLPVTLPLMLMLLLVIGSVFVAISVLIASLIVLLVAIVVAGVVIPLVGIIFGIIKAYTVFPVGLYEIGLAIKMAGVAMFCGILVYNLAVRLLPFAMKKFGILSSFLFRSLAKLVKRIRKECVTL